MSSRDDHKVTALIQEAEQQRHQIESLALINKQTDEITFDILADTVAKEIAIMLRGTITRPSLV